MRDRQLHLHVNPKKRGELEIPVHGPSVSQAIGGATSSKGRSNSVLISFFVRQSMGLAGESTCDNDLDISHPDSICVVTNYLLTGKQVAEQNRSTNCEFV